MPTCKFCGEEFPSLYHHNGTFRNFSNRKYCVNCRPIGAAKPIRQKKQREILECLVCTKPLADKQRKYCSAECRLQATFGYQTQQQRAIVRKLKLIEIAGGSCAICGYNKNITAFHFHHLDPSKKRFRLDSRAISNRSWQSILEEFEKCILLCGNCHAETHNPDLIYDELVMKFENIELH